MPMPMVEQYREILPDWSALRAFEEHEKQAVAELLVALTQLAGWQADSPQFEALKACWVDLFCEADWIARAAFSAHLDVCERRIGHLFEHPGAVDILLTSACGRLGATHTQFHVLCVAMITAFLSASNPQQIELIERVGQKLNLSNAQIDELFARMRAGFNVAQKTQSAAQPAAALSEFSERSGREF